MVDVMFDCIGFITIQVCCRECMVMRCLHVSSYIWAILFCIWILFVLVLMFFQGLHSCVEIFMRGMFRGRGYVGVFILGLRVIFNYDVFIYCMLFLGIVCEYYVCVVLNDY